MSSPLVVDASASGVAVPAGVTHVRRPSLVGAAICEILAVTPTAASTTPLTPADDAHTELAPAATRARALSNSSMPPLQMLSLMGHSAGAAAAAGASTTAISVASSGSSPMRSSGGDGGISTASLLLASHGGFPGGIGLAHSRGLVVDPSSIDAVHLVSDSGSGVRSTPSGTVGLTLHSRSVSVSFPASDVMTPLQTPTASSQATPVTASPIFIPPPTRTPTPALGLFDPAAHRMEHGLPPSTSVDSSHHRRAHSRSTSMTNLAETSQPPPPPLSPSAATVPPPPPPVHARAESTPASSSSPPSSSSSTPSTPPSSASPSLTSSSSFSSGLRARIRATVRSTGGSSGGGSGSHTPRGFDDLHREWSGIIARWNEFQVSGLHGVGTSTRTDFASNQARLGALLLAHGVPGNLRATVWLMLIGNGLQLTSRLFQDLKRESGENRATYEQWRRRMNDAGETPLSPRSSAPLDARLSLFAVIDQDLPRTFPELAFFHADGPYEAPLRNVLECTALYRIKHATTRVSNGSYSDPDSPVSFLQTGYVQGMSFLASILLLALGDDEFLCFVALANLLENPAERLSALFSMEARETDHYLAQFEAQMRLSLPALARHFDDIHLRPDMYIFRWIFSVYSQSLELDTVFRVWDCFLWESFKTRGQLPTTSGASNSNGAATSSHASTSTRSSSGPRAVLSAAFSSARGALSSSRPASAGSVGARSGSTSIGGGGTSVAAPGGTGFPFLFRVALGILGMFESGLRACAFEECLYFLHHLPGRPHAGTDSAAQDDAIDVDVLFQYIKAVQLDSRIWQRVRPQGEHDADTALDAAAGTIRNNNRTTTLLAPTPMRGHSKSKSDAAPIDNAAAAAVARSQPDYSGRGSP